VSESPPQTRWALLFSAGCISGPSEARQAPVGRTEVNARLCEARLRRSRVKNFKSQKLCRKHLTNPDIRSVPENTLRGNRFRRLSVWRSRSAPPSSPARFKSKARLVTLGRSQSSPYLGANCCVEAQLCTIEGILPVFNDICGLGRRIQSSPRIESNFTGGRKLTDSKIWSHPPGSNRRPADYESAALPTELGWLAFTMSDLRGVSAESWIQFESN
jgi:hypothetical protein